MRVELCMISFYILVLVVKQNAQGLTFPRCKNYKLFFDNSSCTLDLLLQLKNMKLTTATTRIDRIKGCSLVAENCPKKQEIGSSCHIVDLKSDIAVFRWFNKKSIPIVTIYADPTDMQTIQRWDRASKKHI